MKTTIDIAALMDEHDISQRKMAEILNVSQSYVSEIKNGRKPLSLKHEELLIMQFGKEICDNFRVAKIDARRTQNFKGSVSGGKMPMGDLYEGGQQSSQATDIDLQSQLEECRAELAKAKKDLEQANKRIDKLLSIIENLSKE